MILESIIELTDYMNRYSTHYNAIIVEGYDGVGKGRVLNRLSECYDVIPYRPDYKFWDQFGLNREDRWKISGYFWDIFSSFYPHLVVNRPMLFDRGVISGIVYNEDERLLKCYKEHLLRDEVHLVIHVYVTCTEEDYIKFLEARNPTISDIEKADELMKFKKYDKDYKRVLKESGINYVVFMNYFDKSIYKKSQECCLGCGHYCYGKCMHPDNYMNQVDKYTPRCSRSTDPEVQDVSKVLSV